MSDSTETDPKPGLPMVIPEDPQEILSEMRDEMFRYLLGRLKQGKATHQELSIVRNVLKDNGLIVPPKMSEVLGEEDEMEPLPDLADPEWEE